MARGPKSEKKIAPGSQKRKKEDPEEFQVFASQFTQERQDAEPGRGREGHADQWVKILQPLRDLAANWDIDITAQLDEYMESCLSSVDPTSVNFAEAAILIHGSASVYSKKVEYLYKLLFDVLDVLISKQTKEGKLQSSVREDGEEENEIVDDDVTHVGEPGTRGGVRNLIYNDDTFLPIELEEAKNIDMVESKESEPTQGSMTPISRLKEILRIRRAKSAFVPTIRKASLSGKKTKVGGNLNLATLTIHSSGALVFDDSDEKLLDETFGNNVADDRIESLRVNENGESAPIWGNRANDDDDDSMSFDQVEFPDGVAQDRSFDSPVKSNKESTAVKVSTQEIDPFETLDPHHVDEKICKANFKFKKGRTWLNPMLNRKAKGFDIGSMFQLKQKKSNSMLSPSFLVFKPFYEELVKKKNQERMSELRKGMDSKITHSKSDFIYAKNSTLSKSFDNVDGLDNDYEDDVDDFEFDDDNLVLDAEVELVKTTDESVKEDDVEIIPEALVQEANLKLEDDNFIAYDDHCRYHMETYLRQTESLSLQSGLVERIHEWEKKVIPILEEQDSHPEFDIDEYGFQMVHVVEENLSRKQKKKGSNNDIISFEETVRGKPTWDIARYFLATLQLTNQGDISITKPTSPGENSSFMISLSH